MAEFEITGPNGARYIVDAPDEAAAQRAADFINTRIEAGDFDLAEGAPADIAVQREAPETTGAGAFLRNFADTGFFNWGDEIASFGNALGLAPIDTLGGDQQAFWNNPEGFWSAFENNMDEFQRLREADSQQHPFASGTGDVTGALAGALAAVPRIGAAVVAAAPRAAIPLAARIEAAALGRPVASAVGRGAAEGAAFGALAGAGEGRGNRGQSAAMGGTIGAMGGAAIGGAIAGLGPVVRRYWNVLRNNNSEGEARRQLIQALQRDGFDVTSPEGVATLRQEFQNFTGRPLSLADVGAATRARAGVGLRTPSAVQQQSIDQVTQRTQSQRDRLSADIRANVAPRTDVHAAEEALVNQRAEMAEELRRRALFEEVPFERQFDDQELDDALAIWASGGGYSSGLSSEQLNAALRRGETLPPAMQTFLDQLQEAFRVRSSVASEAVPVHRGISFVNPEDYSGDAVTRMGFSGGRVPGFSSVSTNRRTAEEFATMSDGVELDDYNAGLLMSGQIPPGTPVLRVPRNDAWGDEEELLLPPGRFQVQQSGSVRPSSESYIGSDEIPTGRFEYTPDQLPSNELRSRVVDDPQLNALARLPDARRALSAAVERSRAERDLLQAQGKDASHLGAGIFDENQLQQLLDSGAALDVRTLDMLKRYLDDEVNALYRRGQGNTFSAAQAGQARDLRNAIRERLRASVPEYADYLDAYAGSSEMIDALEAGRSFRRLDPEQIVTEQAGRSRAGQELYRVGAARDLEDLVRGSTDAQLPANRIANSDISREQIRSLGLEDFDRLIRNIQQERQLNLLPMELRGSQTEARRAAREDAEGALTTNVPFNPVSGFGWMGALLRGATNRASTQRNAAVNESLLPRALETNPQAIEGVIAELEATGQELLAAQLRRRMSARSASRAYGTLIGGAVALPQE